MRKIIIIALASIIAFTTLPSMSLAKGLPTISKEKTERVHYDGAIEKNGHIYVPVREMFKALKAPLMWDPRNRTVKTSYKDYVIELKVDSKEGYVNNNLHQFDVAPMMYKGRMYVPLKEIAKILSSDIEEHEIDDIKLKYLWGYTFEKFLIFEEVPMMKLPHGIYSLEDAWKIADRFAGVRVHEDVVMEFKGMEGNSYLFHQYYIPGYNKIKDDSHVVNTEKLIEQGLTRFLWNQYLVHKDTGQISKK